MPRCASGTCVRTANISSQGESMPDSPPRLQNMVRTAVRRRSTDVLHCISLKAANSAPMRTAKSFRETQTTRMVPRFASTEPRIRVPVRPDRKRPMLAALAVQRSHAVIDHCPLRRIRPLYGRRRPRQKSRSRYFNSGAETCLSDTPVTTFATVAAAFIT